jgi:hypothetical protein
MPTLATIELDPNHPKREIDLVMNNDDVTYGDLSEGEEALKRLATSIHEGQGLNQTPRPIIDTKRTFAIAVTFEPTRTRQISGKSGTSMRTAIGLYTTPITG